MTEKVFPPKQIFLKHIWNRTHDYKKNWLQVITGETGAGKSYAALRMAELLDKHFTIDNVCFSARQFVNRVDKIKYNGQVLIFDDAGAMGMSNKRWWSETNIMTNFVLQTFRYKHAIVFFCVPDLSFVDSATRKLIKCFSVVTRDGTRRARMRIYKISVDRREGKIYYPFYRFNNPNNGHVVKVNTVNLNLPSPEILKEYEERHMAEKDKLTKDAQKKLAAIERKEIGSTEEYEDDIKHIKENMKDFTNVRNNLEWKLIQFHLNIPENKAKLLKTIIEKQANEREEGSIL